MQVSASYPGANAQVVEATVAQPLEQQVNGVEGMIYIASTSGNDGTLNMQVTFEVGADPDIAQVNVQNRVALAQPQLPEEVVRQGISVRKQSTNLLLVINLTSPDKTYDSLYLSNYGTINLLDALSRVPASARRRSSAPATTACACGSTPGAWRASASHQRHGRPCASRTCRSRPARSAARRVIRISSSSTPSEPRVAWTTSARSRTSSSAPVRTDPACASGTSPGRTGAQLRLLRLLNGNPSANIGIYQLPGANALAVANRVQRRLSASPSVPADLKASILYDTTRFVDESIKEVVKTLLEALLLVVLVVYVFLQDWRMTVIPTIAIPVSLIGTFAALNALGFSINVITLFGLVLSIGIVVDDASSSSRTYSAS